MKKINILIVLSFLFLFSCKDFLNLTPRNSKIVNSVEDYRDIMASYVKFLKTPNTQQEKLFGISASTYPCFVVANSLGLYTGETNLNLESSSLFDKTNNVYTVLGKKSVTWLNSQSNVWNQYYEFLGAINYIINGIEEVDCDDEDIKNYVKGEALTWRAFGYYKLLQYYSPYKETEYGVPMNLRPDKDIGTTMLARPQQMENYKQILSDCNEALSLLEKTPSNTWNLAWTNEFLNSMMSSVYAWKAMSGCAEETDWANAEKYASEAMLGRQLVNNSSDFKELFDCNYLTINTELESDEFSWRLIAGSNVYQSAPCDLIYAYYSRGWHVDGKVNLEYYRKFKDDDIRKEAYFTSDGANSDKYNLMGQDRGGCIMYFRLAEMYLIKAEALLRQDKLSEARAILIEFKSKRYTGVEEVPSDKEGLLQDILDERLREFYMENDFRWLDMKRLGITVSRVVQGETFTLEADDFRYCFPIPNDELLLNKNMVQTPGWEKITLDD